MWWAYLLTFVGGGTFGFMAMALLVFNKQTNQNNSEQD